MAGEKYKARKLSTTKEVAAAAGGKLPQTVHPSIHPRILETLVINNGTGNLPVTKSWLPTATRCNNQRRQLFHVITGSSKPSESPDRRRHDHFLGDSSIADTVYDMPDASHWCLLKSDATARTHPPPTIPSYRFNCLGPPLQLNGVISPNSPTTGLMVRYAVYRNVTRNSVWYKQVAIRHECTRPDPFDPRKKAMEFCNVVEFEGKFYVMSLQGTLAVMQVDDTRLKITGISAVRAVPSVRCRFFKEYLVEMEGEIVLVFLIHERSLAVVDGVEVYRLDFAKLDWVKVGRLRGKTVLFSKEICIWEDSVEFGCRDDCVYFTQGEDNNSWCVYDMKTCSISPYSFQNLD